MSRNRVSKGEMIVDMRRVARLEGVLRACGLDPSRRKDRSVVARSAPREALVADVAAVW